MIRSGQTQSSTRLATLLAASVLSLTLVLAHAAVPFSEATVTRLQNKVSYGTSTQAGNDRPASVQDVVKADNYLLTETDARAELQYPDGSIVRIGQNTVFSFEADSRTLALKKGTFIFYVPKGLGNTTIKTPSLTAAITGTVGKVSDNIIAIVEGSIKLVPSGRVVNAGQYARMNPDGTITIDYFDPTKALDGKLMSFNGPLPPFREALLTASKLPEASANDIEMIERTANLPSSQRHFFPPPRPAPPAVDRPKTGVFVPPPSVSSPERPNPSY